MMTNAFSTRRQNKNKIEDLYQSIKGVLDEMSYLRKDSERKYDQYIFQLEQNIPHQEKFSLPAEVIAARLSDDEDEQHSICASLRGLANSAETKRRGKEWNKDHPDYDTCADLNAALPTLKTSMRTTTRHFAELNDEGSVIRQWDVEKSTATYYLDKKG